MAAARRLPVLQRPGAKQAPVAFAVAASGQPLLKTSRGVWGSPWKSCGVHGTSGSSWEFVADKIKLGVLVNHPLTFISG